MRQYIIDAFTDKVFHGNPAAICILEQWPSGELMLNMAVENNLSETAFAVKKGGATICGGSPPVERLTYAVMRH